MATLFVSDLHLSPERPEIVALFRRFMQGPARKADSIYILGDLFEVLPVLADRSGPVVQATLAAVRDVLGRDAEIVCSPGTYDQKHIDRIGRLKDCIAYGPGILDLAHQPDEFVLIDDLVASAQVMAAAAHRLLTLDA